MNAKADWPICSRPVGVRQAVERIVSVVAGRIDPLAVEDGDERRILDAGDIAHGIIGIAQILYDGGIREYLRREFRSGRRRGSS